MIGHEVDSQAGLILVFRSVSILSAASSRQAVFIEDGEAVERGPVVTASTGLPFRQFLSLLVAGTSRPWTLPGVGQTKDCFKFLMDPA